MKLKLKEQLDKTGTDRMTLARILWPESPEQSQRVLIGNWINGNHDSIRLDQLQVLCDFFKIECINELFTFDEND